MEDLDAWKQAIRPTTRLLFIETPSNPLARVGDLQAIADIAHAHGALFAVDNTFCTPVLQQPIKIWSDLVDIFIEQNILMVKVVHSVVRLLVVQN